MKNFGRYWKAVIAFVTPGVIATVAAVQTSSPGGENLTRAEGIGIVAACILTGGGVLAAKNAEPAPTAHVDPAAAAAEANAGDPAA